MRLFKRLFDECKSVKKLVCAATVALVSIGLMVTGPTTEVKADTSADTFTLSVKMANYEDIKDTATRINITDSQYRNTDGSINVELNSGNYILTGSNCINGSYAETQIKVGQNAEVNLYLDGLTIVNKKNDGTIPEGWFGINSLRTTTALIVNGTANVCVVGDSLISVPDRIMEVNGRLNFVKSVGMQN